jgi:hypothetical protein
MARGTLNWDLNSHDMPPSREHTAAKNIMNGFMFRYQSVTSAPIGLCLSGILTEPKPEVAKKLRDGRQNVAKTSPSGRQTESNPHQYHLLEPCIACAPPNRPLTPVSMRAM